VTTSIRNEWLKLRTVRGPWLLLAAALAVLVAGIAGLLVSVEDLSSTTQSQAVAHTGLLSIFTLVFGILAVAGEHRHETIGETYLATPRRPRVLAAKLVSYTAVGGAFGLVSAGAALLTTAVGLAVKGSSLDLSDEDTWRALAGGVAWIIAFTACGVGLGALIRNLAAAIAAALAWIAVVEGIVGQFLGGLDQWLPFTSGAALNHVPVDASRMPQWQAGLVLVAYAILLVIAALSITVRRDVT
jgi:ABC-2 type transport system permease protein